MGWELRGQVVLLVVFCLGGLDFGLELAITREGNLRDGGCVLREFVDSEQGMELEYTKLLLDFRLG